MNPLKCDYCDKPAVVHEVTVKNGLKKEVHLCEEPAREAGVVLPSHQPINQMLSQFLISQTSKGKATAKKPCPTCGMTYRRFRQTGNLGCPDCYQAFEEQLAPLIQRAQNGADHHRGKTPRRAGASDDRQLQIRQLIRELDEAVADEKYERAAQLRDRLRGLDPQSPGSKAVAEPDNEPHRSES